MKDVSKCDVSLTNIIIMMIETVGVLLLETPVSMFRHTIETSLCALTPARNFPDASAGFYDRKKSCFLLNKEP